MRAYAAAVVALLAGSASSQAAVTFVSQTRYASATSIQYSAGRSAKDFGAFEATVHGGGYRPEEDPWTAYPESTASQTSSLTADGITASGEFTSAYGWHTLGSHGRSFLDVVFAVDVPTEYSLTGTWDMRYTYLQTAPYFELSGSSVDYKSGLAQLAASGWQWVEVSIYEVMGLSFDIVSTGAVSLNASGVLSPGEYRMKIDFGGQHGAEGEFDVSLLLTPAYAPAPGSAAVLLLGAGIIRRRRR